MRPSARRSAPRAETSSAASASTCSGTRPGAGPRRPTARSPLLLGAMGVALARGAQRHVMACVKHYAVNSMENARFSVDVQVDERTLHEVYLPHFRAVVEAGVASVMSAYNSVNGEWCGQNRTLLTEILRDEWGFEGFVMSDFIWGLRDPVGSLAAGLDIEMPFAQQRARTLDAGARLGRRVVGRRRPGRAPDPAHPAEVRRGGAGLACPRSTWSPRRSIGRSPGEVAARSMVLLRNEPVGGRSAPAAAGGAAVPAGGGRPAGRRRPTPATTAPPTSGRLRWSPRWPGCGPRCPTSRSPRPMPTTRSRRPRPPLRPTPRSWSSAIPPRTRASTSARSIRSSPPCTRRRTTRTRWPSSPGSGTKARRPSAATGTRCGSTRRTWR